MVFTRPRGGSAIKIQQSPIKQNCPLNFLVLRKKKERYFDLVHRLLGGCSVLCLSAHSPDPLRDLEITETGENDSGKVTVLSICPLLCGGETQASCTSYDRTLRKKGDHQSGVLWWCTRVTLCYFEHNVSHSIFLTPKRRCVSNSQDSLDITEVSVSLC